MHTHFNNILLDLPEILVLNITKVDNQILIEASPVEHTQCCPVCASAQTIRRGTVYTRKVRHLSAFGQRVYLLLPVIRMSCTICHALFVWHYEFVAPKKRYTNAFEAALPKHVIGATVKHAARITETPASTLNRIVTAWMSSEATRIQQVCQEQAKASTQLVLGIDDFAILYMNGKKHLLSGTNVTLRMPLRKSGLFVGFNKENP